MRSYNDNSSASISASGKRPSPPTHSLKSSHQERDTSYGAAQSENNNTNNRKRDLKYSDSTKSDVEDLNQSRDSVMSNKNSAVKVGPEASFTSYPELPDQTCKNLVAKGIKNLFPIQQECFYPILERKDVIARDLTGSGKTLAFALPVLEYLRSERLLGSRKVQAIVLAPTRELAIQVSNTFQYLKHSPNEFTCLTVYGGVPIEPQTNELKRGVELFVGTTGRVLDHIERGNIDFSHIKTIILDEADVMLKLGFKEDIDRILSNVREQSGKDLQICLFSATIPTWVRDVASEHMKRDLVYLDLVSDLKNKTAKKVQHLAINCPYHNRLQALQDLLVCYGKNGKTLVFTQTKADANSLLMSDKIKCDLEVMHGDIAQNQREVTLKRFREGKFQVLVATDVASRGLDIPNVELVIQIEPPKDAETYIHRSGRTARAGASGVCITFYTEKTKFLIDQIEDQAGVKLQRIGVPQPDDLIKATSTGILQNLECVSVDVLSMFEATAKQLLAQNKGNAIAAISRTLAYISGHRSKAISARSLLTGQENMLTLKMTSLDAGKRLSQDACQAIIERWWSSRIIDASSIKAMRNGQGVVFEIKDNYYERFLDNYEHIKNQEGTSLDFTVSRCQDLPELEDQGNFGGSESRQSDYNGGHGGASSYNGRSSRGGFVSGRGGFDQEKGRGGFESERGRGRGSRGGYNNDSHGQRPSGGSGWKDSNDHQGEPTQSRGGRGGLSRGGYQGNRGSESHSSSNYSTPHSSQPSSGGNSIHAGRKYYNDASQYQQQSQVY